MKEFLDAEPIRLSDMEEIPLEREAPFAEINIFDEMDGSELYTLKACVQKL